MRHIRAPLAGFDTVPSIEAMLAQIDPLYRGRPTRRFPVRYLRYWFMRYMLEELYRRLHHPLRVLEVGIGRGKMLAFMDGAQVDAGQYAPPNMIACWDALSGQADPRTLRRYSYSSFQQADIDKPFEISKDSYDAIVVLHVLEHLIAPEATLQRLLPGLREDGLLVGGSPTMPNCLAGFHGRRLRRKNAHKINDPTVHKHLSVITPRRIRNFARAERLSVELLTGAFLLRASWNPLEDHSWWLRANLAWGALLPALAGEVYFALRKTRRVIGALIAIGAGELVLELP